MSTPTYGWPTPADTDFVKDGAAAIRDLGDAVDATVSDLAETAVPIGAILMWSGSLATVPTGWHICDGKNGTPDLRGRFVAGAGSPGIYSPGDTGGADVVRLEINNLPAHSHSSGTLTTRVGGRHGHSINTRGTTGNTQSHGHNTVDEANVVARGVSPFADTYDALLTGSPVVSDATADHSHTMQGSTGSVGVDPAGAHENRPPFYALAFIMRIG